MVIALLGISNFGFQWEVNNSAAELPFMVIAIVLSFEAVLVLLQRFKKTDVKQISERETQNLR